MNPELPDDFLDEALRRRAAATAPSTFTSTMLLRLEAARAFSPLSRFWMDQGLGLGLALAVAGLPSVVDVNRLGALLGRGLQAPSAAVLAAVAVFCVSAVWWSITADETI